MEHDEWLEPVPDFIKNWRSFLTSIGRYDCYGCNEEDKEDETDSDDTCDDGEATQEMPKETHVSYDYVGATGCSGECYFTFNQSFENGVWSVAAGAKNKNKELEVFFTKVLVPMSSYIEECSIITDYYLDYRPRYEYRFPEDPEDDDGVRNYTDKKLRTTHWKDLSFF